MAYCSHYTADTDPSLTKNSCNPCFGALPRSSNEIVYYPTGSNSRSMDFLDFYIKDFVMGILPQKYVKRITIDKTLPDNTSLYHGVCYPAIHLISTNLTKKEAIAILQMFRYPFEWSSFESEFVKKMQEGYTPTDAWFYAHSFDNPDHGLLDYQSLCNRTHYKPGTYNLTELFKGMGNAFNIFSNFRLEV